jgi:aspartate aminotransferase-like enzyme
MIADALKKDPGIKAVYVQASETSTGVAHDVKTLAQIVRAHGDTILVVDAITALGVFDLKVDDWGIDVVITGSQKALMLPPGLAFVSVSEKAWQVADKAKNAAFYFNFKKERENQQKNQTAFTPAVSLIIGLQEVLKMLKAEGLDALFGRQAAMARAMREGVKAAGLALFPKESPSDALTAISAPDGIDGQTVYKNLRVQYGITAAGGQDHLKGKIFRVSHMGYMDRFDVITAVAAIEMVLKGLGHPIKLGSGVAKAQELLMVKS